jgi:hypothetical protein
MARTTTTKGTLKKPARWSQTRQQIFLDHLAASSNVAASERRAGMSAGSAYRLRVQSPEFREAWQAALQEGYGRLELGMLERAMKGTVKRVEKGGEVTETVEYSDRLAMALLSAHRSAVKGPMLVVAPVSDARERLARKLSEMNRRMGGEG